MARKLTALVAVMAVLAAGCGGSSSSEEPSVSTGPPSGTLRLFAYSDGFAKGLIQPFKNANPKVDLETTPFDSVSAATAKLRAGYDTDVVNSCVEEGTINQVNLGLLKPIDTSKIKDWDKIYPTFKKLPGIEVDGKVYMIPIDSGVTGIMYDSNTITTPPDSWADLFDDQYKGQVTMEDNPEVAIQVGALAMGITDPVHLTEDQINQVKDYLIAHRDNFRTYYSSDADIESLMAQGEVTIAEGYPGNVNDLNNDGETNIKFNLAKEGQIVWTCGYGISSSAQNENAAYALLNYYLSPKAQVIEASKWDYTMTNEDTAKLAPADVVESARLTAPAHFGNIIPASPPPNFDLWIKAWNEVKAAG
jgi:spermidine/putrescine transport system substrate-binding protein